MPQEFENYFFYSAMWAFGGTLVEEHRPWFSQWWREQWNDFVLLPGDEEVRKRVVESNILHKISNHQEVEYFSRTWKCFWKCFEARLTCLICLRYNLR